MSEASHALLERLIDRRLAPLQEQLRVQHCLLLELAAQLPRPALLRVAQRLECEEPLRKDWHLYVCQLAGLVDGQTPPALGRAVR